MEFKNSKIVSIINSFTALEESEKNGNDPLKLSAAVAWKRRLNKKAFLGVVDEIEKAMEEVRAIYRDDEHSDPDPNNAEARTVKAEYRIEFAQKQKDILDQVTDVNIRTVKLADLPDELTDLQMDTLEFMVEEE